MSGTLERFTLDNGLRVVVTTDSAAPVVAMSTHYDIGFRTEPEGRSGFAHLFEHIMFRGSANVPDGKFSATLARVGGGGDASTSLDQTNFHLTVPTNAFEVALFLESDRMGWPLLTEEAHRAECEVVKEETRLRITNQPKASLVGQWWVDMRALAFDGFANSHNGMGSFEEIEASSAAETREFFETYYPPANAVLAIVGDVGSHDVPALVDKWFGVIPARPKPAITSVAEPAISDPRRASFPDPLGTSPMLAIAWRTPDPVAQVADHGAMVILTELLVGGEDGRLVRRLLSEEKVATSVAGFVEFFGHQFVARDPMLMCLNVHHAGADADRLLGLVDEEIAALDRTLDESALGRATTTVVLRWLQLIDNFTTRAVYAGGLELIWGRAELIDEMAQIFRRVTLADIFRVAQNWLTPQTRSAIEYIPKRESDS